VNIRADCTSGPLPTIRLVDSPAQGNVSIKRGKLNVTNFRKCLAAEVPAFVAIYKSKPEFTGKDTLTLEVVKAEGVTELRKFVITIAKGQEI
jgi:hypothetical protein